MQIKELIAKQDIVKKIRSSRRIKITTSCRDTDYINKVENAGNIMDCNGTKCFLMHNGVVLKTGGFHDRIMKSIINGLKGHHEPQEEKAFHEVLKTLNKGSVMVELGSYWSYYSLWFNKNIPEAENYMIEPLKENIELGKENFSLNNAEGTFERCFIGQRNVKNVRDNIPQINIDTFMKKHKLNYVDIIHSDIQGSEYEMLLGALDSMKKRSIGFFFISTHGDKLHSDCVKLLTDMNYKIICSHTPAESYSADGLIVAKEQGIQNISNIKISKRKVIIPFLNRF